MALIFSVLAALLTLADVYVCQWPLSSVSWIVKGWLFLPAVLLWALVLWIFFTGDTRQMILNGVMWLTLCVVFPTILFALTSLIGKGLGLLWQPLSPAFSWLGLGVATVWFIVAVYGSVFGWRRLEVKDTKVNLPDLPENFEGYKIAQLTDFHIGVYGAAPGMVNKIVERVNALHPDLIVFTGDLVNTSPNELPEFMAVLSQLKARDGVISVLGNHDYCIYHHYTDGDTPERALERVVNAEAKMGWRLLRNESVQIKRGADSIAIVGVENAGGRHFPNRANLQRALRGVPAEECKILLSHDPSHWRSEVLPKTDISLMLAGHTHAMQFRVGNFSPSEWTYKEWGGLYCEGNQQLFVSTGVGGNIAFRFGAYPTIDLITLKK